MTASTDYGTKFCLGVKRVFRSKRRIKYFVRKKTIQMPTCSAGFSFAQGVYFIFAVPCVFARENDSPMFFTQTQHFLFFFSLQPRFSTQTPCFPPDPVFFTRPVFSCKPVFSTPRDPQPCVFYLVLLTIGRVVKTLILRPFQLQQK